MRDRAGFAVEVVGDVNGDGHPDVAVGAPQVRGTARIHTQVTQSRRRR